MLVDLFFGYETGGNIFLRNVGAVLPNRTASHARGEQSWNWLGKLPLVVPYFGESLYRIAAFPSASYAM
jgi:hypothetical protein